MELIKPKALKPGDTIGIYTPSSPCHVWFKEKFEHGIKQIEKAGFKVVLGTLTEKYTSEGYRSGTPQERAEEFMQLIRYPEVKCLMSTIGGVSSNAMIEHLDFDEIAANPKIITGYSDVTSLHMAIHSYTGLVTFYGPAVIPSFGEYPLAFDYTVKSFLDAVQGHREGKRELEPPKEWSNHFRDAFSNAWKTSKREYKENPGWYSLSTGKAKGQLIAANFNTLMACAGTTYFPKLDGKILMIEEMECELGMQERKLVQFKNMGGFQKISGLIVSKTEVYKSSDAPFELNDLLLEIIGDHDFPIMTNFDCGHTHPMIILGQGIEVEMNVKKNSATLTLLEPMIKA
jgi:muramoyltetrapeptide carboxypeptidase